MPAYSKSRIEKLIDGTIPFDEAKEMMSDYKDLDRFDKFVEILQERVPWEETILLPLTDHLYVVSKGGSRIVKCDCGHEFGDYRENWKLEALVNVRDTEAEFRHLYPMMMHADPEWMVLREFFCPGCKTLLSVEPVTPGYPLVFEFQPDIDGLYNEWLGRPVPE